LKIKLDKKFILSLEAPRLLEVFLVTAVASVLLIRFFLSITGYPQIGGESLHIAHMLWGGLLMMVSVFLLLAYLGKPIKYIAAIIGGIGFGTFIDEVGKLLTHDSNYFFQPAIALIYIVFILLFLVLRYVNRKRKHSEEELLINALEITKEAVIEDLDENEKKHAVRILKKCRSDDLIAKALKSMIHKLDAVPPSKPSFYTRLKSFIKKIYFKLAVKKWFTKAVVVIFVLQALLASIQTAVKIRNIVVNTALVFLAAFWIYNGIVRKKYYRSYIGLGFLVAFIYGFTNLTMPELELIEWLEIIFRTAPVVLVAVGISRIRRSKIRAYRYFRRAALVTIFFTKIFTFYISQLLALMGLTFDILILVTLNYIISQEE
jgi:hypothetical protein